jgi:hypothetical protein
VQVLDGDHELIHGFADTVAKAMLAIDAWNAPGCVGVMTFGERDGHLFVGYDDVAPVLVPWFDALELAAA